MLRVGNSNYSKGEIAEDLLGRFDVPTYNAGLRRARNVVILKYGGVTKRPGTRVIAEVYDDTRPVKLIPFQFSLENAYALEMGHAYMRPLALGGLVLEEDLQITAISKAFNAQVTVAYHAFTVGQQIFLSGIVGMTELNGRVARVVSVIDANNFTIDINTSSYTTFVSSAGTVRVGAPDPPPAPPPVPDPSDGFEYPPGYNYGLIDWSTFPWGFF